MKTHITLGYFPSLIEIPVFNAIVHIKLVKVKKFGVTQIKNRAVISTLRVKQLFQSAQ